MIKNVVNFLQYTVAVSEGSIHWFHLTLINIQVHLEILLLQTEPKVLIVATLLLIPFH